MTLQRRLTLFFILIVILPLAAAGFVVQRVIIGEIARRAVVSLDPAIDAVTVLYNDRVQALDLDQLRRLLRRPRLVSLLEEARRPKFERYLSNLLSGSRGLDFLVVLDERGKVAGFAHRGSSFLRGFEVPGAREIVRSEGFSGPGFTRTGKIPLSVVGRGTVGHVVGGFWVDDSLLVGSPESALNLSIVAKGEVIASTAELAGTTPIETTTSGTFEVDLHGAATARAEELGGGMLVVASTPLAPINALSQRVVTSMLALLALALLGTSALAYLLARLITQPLEELAEGAAAIAEGRFDHRIAVRSRDEVGRLAEAFNHMSDTLGESVSALSSSRNQLRRAIRRVGETMRSTHDMRQMLGSVLNTALDAVSADAATLWMFSSSRNELYPVRAVNLEMDELGHVRVGEGLVGLVAERATNLLVPQHSAPRPAPNEPSFPVAIAIPLYSQARVMGVISLYREDSDRPFSEEDLDTVVFLGQQGGVAVENVMLHEEAQRLSITDGLTGVWNRRYFVMQFRQIVATALRFERPFSVLMMDLDHFKTVNDTYGHQRGDEILIEFAQRVNRVIREVDTFARYGGEEFICLLSETEVRGAIRTAEKILQAVRAEPFGGVGAQRLNITVSIGVSSYPTHGDSYNTLVEAADRALYRAKQEGRDRVCVAETPQPPGLKLAT